jgi:hypothetical protein
LWLRFSVRSPVALRSTARSPESFEEPPRSNSSRCRRRPSAGLSCPGTSCRTWLRCEYPYGTLGESEKCMEKSPQNDPFKNNVKMTFGYIGICEL